MKRVLFIDRDGTIIREPHDFQVDGIERAPVRSGAITSLARITASTDSLVMVTNQDGLGTESFPESAFWPAQHLVIDTLASENVNFGDVLNRPDSGRRQRSDAQTGDGDDGKIPPRRLRPQPFFRDR